MVFTLDALHWHKPGNQITEQQHYLMALKPNQPTLYRTLEQLYQTGTCLSEAQTVDTSQNRQGHRQGLAFP